MAGKPTVVSGKRNPSNVYQENNLSEMLSGIEDKKREEQYKWNS